MAKGRYYEKSEKMMQKEDGEMIKADYSACANLPQSPIMKDWPKTMYSQGDEAPRRGDSIRGIDNQMNEDVSQARKHRSKSKY